MKLARRFLIVLAVVALVFAVMIAAFYAVEDWRGARAWDAARRDLEARGERLDMAAFIPPPVPDDENLAMAPLFVRMYRYRVDPGTGKLTFPNPWEDTPLRTEVSDMPRGDFRSSVPLPTGIGDWTVARPLDLTKWQIYYRARPDFPHAPAPQAPAEDVLLALTKYAPVLDELAQAAAERPQARFPVNWTTATPWKFTMPHGRALQNFTATLRLRAVAELTLGRNGEAMRDIALMGRLRDAEAVDPVLIALLVDQVQTAFMLQPVWEGLASRRWSAAELGHLQDGLRKIDFLAEAVRAIRCERVSFLATTVDELKAHGGAAGMINAIGPGTHPLELSNNQRFFGGLLDRIPGGWWDQNKAFGFRTMQERVIDPIDVAGHQVRLEKIAAAREAWARAGMTPYTWLMRVIPSSIYESVVKKAVIMQAGVDQAAVSCALERFSLDHHAYPARLDELTPAYLGRVPVDVFDGAPLRYRLTPDGRYMLYSVGWNGRDDGGQTVWIKNTARPDLNEGDLVWQYTEPQPPPSIQRSK